VETKKSYIRYVAHELRTPLNSASLGINLLLDMLDEVQDKEDLDLELQETATDVSKALKVAVDVLSDLMTISKIESGVMTLQKHDLGAKAFVQDGIASLAAEARQKGITVEVMPLATGLNQRQNSLIERVVASVKSRMSASLQVDKALLFPSARELTPLDVVSADKFKVRRGDGRVVARGHNTWPRDCTHRLSMPLPLFSSSTVEPSVA